MKTVNFNKAILFVLISWCITMFGFTYYSPYNKKQNNLQSHDRELTVYTIDSCQYIGILSTSSNIAILSHKGNCKYCNNRLKQLLKNNDQ